MRPTGEGETFFHHDFQWGGRCFFKHFFEKSNQNLLWGKSFFFENWRNPSRDDIIFSNFLGKSCDDILWGKCMFFENGHKYSKKRVFWMKLFWKFGYDLPLGNIRFFHDPFLMTKKTFQGLKWIKINHVGLIDLYSF